MTTFKDTKSKQRKRRIISVFVTWEGLETDSADTPRPVSTKRYFNEAELRYTTHLQLGRRDSPARHD